jgi:hypothetical protein
LNDDAALDTLRSSLRDDVLTVLDRLDDGVMSVTELREIIALAVGDQTAGLAPNDAQLRLILDRVSPKPPPAQTTSPERERTWQQKPRPAGSRA